MVSTFWRFVCEVEVLDVVEDERVESGEVRPSALRTRSLRGIVVDDVGIAFNGGIECPGEAVCSNSQSFAEFRIAKSTAKSGVGGVGGAFA